MPWMSIEPSSNSTTRSIPKASIGYGRVELNARCRSILGHAKNWQHAQFFLDSEQDRVAIQFMPEPNDHTIGVTRKTTHYHVRVDPDNSSRLILYR